MIVFFTRSNDELVKEITNTVEIEQSLSGDCDSSCICVYRIYCSIFKATPIQLLLWRKFNARVGNYLILHTYPSRL